MRSSLEERLPRWATCWLPVAVCIGKLALCITVMFQPLFLITGQFDGIHVLGTLLQAGIIFVGLSLYE